MWCCSGHTPKPRGYFRIDLPEKTYKYFDNPEYPYTFKYPDIAQITLKTEKQDSFWVDIVYPGFNASIYGSYKKIDNNFREIAEDSRTFVFKHISKADGITEQPFENPEKNVYGVLYEIKGNTASSTQFVLTDSTRHFFRGALYFNNPPNKDSIAPVVDFIREDIIVLMETMEWK
jgi:gliding motility-associated lipoprotein GldD